MKYMAYDMKAKKMAFINNPSPVKLKSGAWAVQGKSSITGNKLTRIVGKQKPSM